MSVTSSVIVDWRRQITSLLGPSLHCKRIIMTDIYINGVTHVAKNVIIYELGKKYRILLFVCKCFHYVKMPIYLQMLMQLTAISPDYPSHIYAWIGWVCMCFKWREKRKPQKGTSSLSLGRAKESGIEIWLCPLISLDGEESEDHTHLR